MSLLVSLVCLGFSLQTVAGQEEQSTFSDDFSRGSTAWQLMGTAQRDQTAQCLVLNPAGSEQVGVAFFNAPIRGSFTATFRYKTGGGYHGDGFTMFFYKQHFGPNIDYTYSGSREGFNSATVIPGYGIEFDGWQNIPWDFSDVSGGTQNPQGDPTASHIALIEDFTGNHLAYVNDSRVSDGNWHQVKINVQGSSVNVYVDNQAVLQWSGTLDRTYDGFGLGGSNGGGASESHIIDDFSITAKNIHTPTLTATCATSVAQSSFPVQIRGNLAYNGVGIADAPILLSYSVTGGDSWQDLTLTHTNSNGDYSALWQLLVTGDYMLKAAYKGSDDYLGATDVFNFSVAPCTDQSAFSVTSNSTLSQLAFSSVSKELSFSVSGGSGSTGYMDVYIPNTLVSDVSDLKILLDGATIFYTAQTLGDGWILHATYHHSSHIVTVDLATANLNTAPTQTTSSANSGAGINWTTVTVTAIICATAAIIAVAAMQMTRKKTAD